MVDEVDGVGDYTPNFSSPSTFCYRSRYPSVSVSEDGNRAVVVCHGAIHGYSMYYCVGKVLQGRIEWGNIKDIPAETAWWPIKWPRYYYPKVAVTNKGVVIVAYGKVPNTEILQRCCYRIGSIVNDTTIIWGDEHKFGKGSKVTITTSEYKSKVNVILGNVSIQGLISVRRNVFDTDVNTISPFQESGVHELSNICGGVKEFSIEMNQKFMIIAFATPNKTKLAIHSMIGKLLDNGQIETKPQAQGKVIGHGKNICVSMNQRGLVVLMYESHTARILKCAVGVIDESNFCIQWSNTNEKPSTTFWHGCSPSISLANNNIFLEVHAAQIGTHLLCSVGEICPTQSTEHKHSPVALQHNKSDSNLQDLEHEHESQQVDMHAQEHSYLPASESSNQELKADNRIENRAAIIETDIQPQNSVSNRACIIILCVVS